MPFEEGTKLKVRFNLKGNTSIEDLWDAPLEGASSLESLAQSLHSEIKDSSKKSFVTKRSKKDSLLELKLDIVKRVIKVRLKELDKKQTTAENKVKKGMIYDAIAVKERGNLEDMSIKELKKLAGSL